MGKKSYTIKLLSGVFLAVGLVGFAAFGKAFLAWLRTAGTSPLAALFSLAWSCTFVSTSILTWRRSRLSSLTFLASMGLLMYLLLFIFPGGQLVLIPVFVILFIVAFLGFRHLHRASGPTA